MVSIIPKLGPSSSKQWLLPCKPTIHTFLLRWTGESSHLPPMNRKNNSCKPQRTTPIGKNPRHSFSSYSGWSMNHSPRPPLLPRRRQALPPHLHARTASSPPSKPSNVSSGQNIPEAQSYVIRRSSTSLLVCAIGLG